MSLDIITPEFLFPSPFVLSDRGIRRAIENGDIKLNNSVEEEQFQSASLDVRIGRVLLYDEEVRAKKSQETKNLNSRGAFDYEPSQDHAIVFNDEENISIDLPSKSFSEIYLHDNLESKYSVSIDLRSSRGRLELQMQDFNGEYISLWNWNPNTVRLYGRSRFAQLFFHPSEDIDGHIVCDNSETEKIAKKLGMQYQGPYVLFNLGEHAFKSKKTGIIDTKSKTNTKDTHIEILIDDYLSANTHETIIAQLSPKIELPPDIGIQILHEIPYIHSNYGGLHPDSQAFFIEPRCANAGWIDPGFCGNLTAHIRRTKIPGVFKKGEFMAYGVLFKFKEPVLRPYGHIDLKSNYQNTRGETSRA